MSTFVNSVKFLGFDNHLKITNVFNNDFKLLNISTLNMNQI